ncbi:MAG: SigE family RNA polymerase sigma factor [Nocardioides sp.]|nr:SigE family RNA polymerase sigma factor [Nocardioides sp.]
MRAAFEEYVAARRPALLRTAYLLVGGDADAEDLVQLALVKAMPHWRRIGHDPEGYVRTVLAREATNRWRRRRWREVSTDALPETDRTGDPTSDHAGAVTDRVALQRALMALSPRQRAVVVLRYFDGLTERETAEALGIGLGTVKSHGRDALGRLRELLPAEVTAAL